MNKQVMVAFTSELAELTKEAGFVSELLETVAPKLLNWGKGALEAFTTPGNAGSAFKNGLDYLQKFKTPVVHVMTDGVSMAAEQPNTGWLQKGIGDMVNSARGLGAGLSTENSIGQNLKTFGRNTATTIQRDFRNAQFKTVDLDATKGSGGFFKNIFGGGKPPEIISKDGTDFIKGKFGLPDRQILGKTVNSEGVQQAILKKRMPAQIGAMAMTPVGFGLQTGLSAAGKKDSDGNKQSGVKEGLKQTALWTFARPLGEVSMGVDFAKSFMNKDQKDQTAQ